MTTLNGRRVLLVNGRDWFSDSLIAVSFGLSLACSVQYRQHDDLAAFFVNLLDDDVGVFD